MSKILVAYASKYRATAEIAEIIQASLHEAGLHVDLKPVQEVDSLAEYDTVVLGSAVYAGSWMGSATRFLNKNQAALAERDVWLFSSGPSGDGDPKDLLKGWVYPPQLEDTLQAIQPRDIAVFHGKIDMDALNFGERVIVKMVKAPTGDFRDWEMIGDWARTISESILHPSI